MGLKRGIIFVLFVLFISLFSASLYQIKELSKDKEQLQSSVYQLNRKYVGLTFRYNKLYSKANEDIVRLTHICFKLDRQNQKLKKMNNCF